VDQKKIHKVSCTVILQPFAVESREFHQNAQKLIANTKKKQNFEHLIKCFSFDS